MPADLRAVLDTNVFVSGLIQPKGPAGRILKALKARRFTLVTSPPVNEEILEVLDRPRLRDRYNLAPHLFDIAYILWELAEVIPDPPSVKISSDPDDDKFLAAALGGRAGYLVTGDVRDLLNLREYLGVRIVTPQEFLRVLG